MKMISFIAGIVGIIALTTSCGSHINTVKNGTLEENKNVTLGDAYAAVCDDCKWTEFKTEKGENVVQVTGKIKKGKIGYVRIEDENSFAQAVKKRLAEEQKYGKEYTIEQAEKDLLDHYCIKAVVTAQFLINKDGKKFDVGSVGIERFNAKGHVIENFDLFFQHSKENWYSELLK